MADGPRDPRTDEGLKPPTDEFGRTDPEVLERERRREERMRRRAAQADLGGTVGKRKGKAKGKGKGRRSKRVREEPSPPTPPTPPASAPAVKPATPPPAPASGAPTGERPQASARERAAGIGARANAGRDAMKSRLEARRAARGDARPPDGGKPPRTRSSFKRRRFLALGAALIGLLAIWFLVALFQPFAGKGEGSGTVSVTIPEGADAGQIAEVLDSNGVVTSGKLFQVRLRLSGEAPDIQAGDYTLAKGMSYGTAIHRLTGVAGAGRMVVIPEGYSRAQIAEKLATTGITGDYNQASTTSPGFDPAAYGAVNPPNLEGFLFPATYDLPEGATATDLVAQQLGAFKQNVKGLDLTYAKKKNLTAYDVLKIASMVERETSQAEERPLVAAVIYNRLQRGQPLGIDATTRFETGNYDGELTNEQLQADTPYNTRTNQGLPPTPIGNPGIASIKAAAAPAKASFLYYVVKPGTCGHTFVKTEAEFNAAVEKYKAAQAAAGGSPTSC